MRVSLQVCLYVRARVCIQDVYRYGYLIEIEVGRPCRIKVSCSVYLSTKYDHDNENRKELHGSYMGSWIIQGSYLMISVSPIIIIILRSVQTVQMEILNNVRLCFSAWNFVLQRGNMCECNCNCIGTARRQFAFSTHGCHKSRFNSDLTWRIWGINFYQFSHPRIWNHQKHFLSLQWSKVRKKCVQRIEFISRGHRWILLFFLLLL